MFLFFAFDECKYFGMIPMPCFWHNGLITPMTSTNGVVIDDTTPSINASFA
jgi:hypothetical protein